MPARRSGCRSRRGHSHVTCRRASGVRSGARQAKKSATATRQPGTASLRSSVPVGVGLHIAARPVDGRRARTGMEHEHRGRARLEPVQRLRAQVGTAVFGRDDLDRQIRSAAGPEARRGADRVRASLGNERRVRRAHRVGTSRQDEPRLRAERQAKAVCVTRAVALTASRRLQRRDRARSRRRTSLATVLR